MSVLHLLLAAYADQAGLFEGFLLGSERRSAVQKYFRSIRDFSEEFVLAMR